MGKSDVIVNKLTSGRFWCIILFSVTMCYMAAVEPNIRDAFMALAGAVLRDYFMMKRPNEIPDLKLEMSKPKEEVKS